MIEWNDYPLTGTGGPGQAALKVYPEVLSPQLRNYRDMVVGLPPGYEDGGHRHPVVYMQDGQNLFDPATSYAGDWGLVGTLNAMAPEPVQPILVGIPNIGRRRRYEYSPFRDIIHGGGGGDRYLAFIVETVKPLVDASFRTRPERPNTVIAGSSLGGLISLYGLFRYADIFGAAGVSMSERFLVLHALRLKGMAGDEALHDVRALKALLVKAGHREGRDLSYVEEQDGEHDEEAWGRRFAVALPFLLGARS